DSGEPPPRADRQERVLGEPLESGQTTMAGWTGKEEEEGRLAAALAAMTRCRRDPRRRRGLLARVFHAGGVGDWEGAPNYVRTAALQCRLCRGEEHLRSFRRLALHCEAHAGRLLHRRCADGQRSYVTALQLLAGESAD